MVSHRIRTWLFITGFAAFNILLAGLSLSLSLSAQDDLLPLPTAVDEGTRPPDSQLPLPDWVLIEDDTQLRDEPYTPEALAIHFQHAESAFGVPAVLLREIARVESGFNQRRGSPSLDMAYGVMGLRDSALSQSLPEASRLLGVTPDDLKRDVAQNIRGAAAVLRSYFDEEWGPSAPFFLSDPGSWAGSVKRYLGQASPEAQIVYARLIYQALQQMGYNVDYTNLGLAHESNQVRNGCTASQFVNDVVHAHPSNYTVGRSNPISIVVIHIGEGSYSGGLSWFQNPASNVSAHYFVSRGGRVGLSVCENNTAWHAGNWDTNTRSIGIEHEGFHYESYPASQWQKTAALVRDITQRYNIPRNRTQIIGHSQVPGVTSRGNCPGPNWPWDAFMNEVIGVQPPGTPRIISPTHESRSHWNPLTVQLAPGTFNQTGRGDYHIQIDNNADFSSPEFDNVARDGKWSTSPTIRLPIYLTGGTYHLRARMGDTVQYASGWTPVVRFTMAGDPGFIYNRSAAYAWAQANLANNPQVGSGFTPGFVAGTWTAGGLPGLNAYSTVNSDLVHWMRNGQNARYWERRANVNDLRIGDAIFYSCDPRAESANPADYLYIDPVQGWSLYEASAVVVATNPVRIAAWRGTGSWRWMEPFNTYDNVSCGLSKRLYIRIRNTPPQVFERMALKNPDLESQLIAGEWQTKRLGSGSKRVCNASRAHSGNCAFRFVGNATTGQQQLQQTLRLSNGGQHDLYSLLMYVRPVNVPPNGAVAHVLFFNGTQVVQRKNVPLPTGSSPSYQFIDIGTAPGAAYDRVVVRVVYRGKRGTLWVDNFSLVRSYRVGPEFLRSGASAVDDDGQDWLPLPGEPQGLRD